MITGTTIFGFGGWTAGILLVAFFVSSSLLSHFKQNSAQKQRAAEMFDKGGQRDIWQALANGGAAALFSIAYFFALQATQANSDVIHKAIDLRYGVSFDYSIPCLVAVVGSLATVTADTWATELGVLSQSKPRLITNLLQAVEPGTSGGISGVGLMSAFAGSLFISIVFLSFAVRGFSDRAMLILVTTILGGFIGSLFDSLLGATKQAIYFSQQRQKETEKAFEKDGTPNKHLRGWKWLNNDWVNFISSVVGALVAAGLVILI
jgi:uncharacterized membrane protein